MTRFNRPLRRWINPSLGAVVFAGYLMTGNPATADVTTSDSAAVAQVRLAGRSPATANKGGDIIPYSALAHSQITRSSMTDVLHTALGTVLGAAWLMGGAWVGIRSARGSTPLSQSADQTRNKHRLRFM